MVFKSIKVFFGGLRLKLVSGMFQVSKAHLTDSFFLKNIRLPFFAEKTRFENSKITVFRFFGRKSTGTFQIEFSRRKSAQIDKNSSTKLFLVPKRIK
jgi:hypothetical protein